MRSTVAIVVAILSGAAAWKSEHNCVSCHHAGLVVWSMREAKQRGHAVDEPVLAELTKWVAESGDGKTGVPRPAGIPKALNAKAVWFALALGADPEAGRRSSQKGLKLLLKTVKSDQTENGSWSSWPETRPPIFGNSDESMTALATLAVAARGRERRRRGEGRSRQGRQVARRNEDRRRPAVDRDASGPLDSDWAARPKNGSRWSGASRSGRTPTAAGARRRTWRATPGRPARRCTPWPTRASSPTSRSSRAPTPS